MINKEKKELINQLHEQIVQLKLTDPNVQTKLTIQKLQQELSKLTNDT